ncbi:immediate early response gene 2 protein [Clinocottus analis]|uniref:immediate early response gene 2 protein n=1 Tax=Clinocottus analis TaxID=304258 RepID=UPI0035BEDACF
MEVTTEAKRIMVVALGKLYSSRTQRGGLRLHRSLLLTLVMKSARDMYHAAQATAESVANVGYEQQQPAAEGTTEPTGAQTEHLGAASLAAGKPRTFTREEVAGSPTEVRRDAENKENMCPSCPAQHSRKRRGKAALEPDFLPCKKAKLEQANCPQQLSVNSVLLDYVNCSSKLAAPPSPMLLPRAIAAC